MASQFKCDATNTESRMWGKAFESESKSRCRGVQKMAANKAGVLRGMSSVVSKLPDLYTMFGQTFQAPRASNWWLIRSKADKHVDDAGKSQLGMLHEVGELFRHSSAQTCSKQLETSFMSVDPHDGPLAVEGGMEPTSSQKKAANCMWARQQDLKVLLCRRESLKDPVTLLTLALGSNNGPNQRSSAVSGSLADEALKRTLTLRWCSALPVGASGSGGSGYPYCEIIGRQSRNMYFIIPVGKVVLAVSGGGTETAAARGPAGLLITAVISTFVLVPWPD
ncbi:hypothetical protein B0T17DRAFT_511407 [Bombardia bombarda]|uniref:Uncharacterized protein n=1 Tax=Bombardia bombarda TaxID=252184 RepID=A0AA39U5V0_9PEZI|nr:hypothetical protein B0T17DRAFT_511407 [Bombardia bombarda]